MKTFYKLSLLMLAFTMLTLIGMAQTYQKKPLYQIFTASTCGPCVWGNFIADAVLDANEGEFSLVKYQVNWPGNGDPYFVQEADDRRDYYIVTGVPDMYINDTNVAPYDLTQSIFDLHTNQMTSMGINIDTAEITASGMINIDLELEVDANYAAGLKLQVAVVERLTTGNASTNGEREFHNVMLHMFPNGYGTSLPALTVGNNQSYSFNYDMSTTFMEQASDLRVVVFVEDSATKEIIQSSMVDVTALFTSYSTTITVTDCAGNVVPDATVFLDFMGEGVTDANGELVYERMIDGTYTYDAKAPGLIPTTGSLTVSGGNVTETAVLDIPLVIYLEDFSSGVPATWGQFTAAGSGDMVLEYNGTVILYNQSAAFPPLMLVTDSIDITGATKVTFDLGDTDPYTEPVCAFGYLTDPTDTATFVELMEIEVGVLETSFESYEFDLTTSGLSGKVNFAFSFVRSGIGLEGGFFAIDNFALKNIGVVENLNAYVSNVHQSTIEWDGYGICGTASAAFEQYKIYRSEDGVNFTLRDSLITEDYYNDVNLDEKTYEYYVTVVMNGEETESSDTVSVIVTSMENIKANNIEISPNPASDYITVSLDEKMVEVQVINQFGQIVLRRMIDAKSYRQDVSELSAGVYILNIRTEDTVISKRFIKE